MFSSLLKGNKAFIQLYNVFVKLYFHHVIKFLEFSTENWCGCEIYTIYTWMHVMIFNNVTFIIPFYIHNKQPQKKHFPEQLYEQWNYHFYSFKLLSLYSTMQLHLSLVKIGLCEVYLILRSFWSFWISNTATGIVNSIL